MKIETLTWTASINEFYNKRKEMGHAILGRIVWKKGFLSYSFFSFFLAWKWVIHGLIEGENPLRREKLTGRKNSTEEQIMSKTIWQSLIKKANLSSELGKISA